MNQTTITPFGRRPLEECRYVRKPYSGSTVAIALIKGVSGLALLSFGLLGASLLVSACPLGSLALVVLIGVALGYLLV